MDVRARCLLGTLLLVVLIGCGNPIDPDGLNVVQTPVIDLPDGTYSTDVDVALSCETPDAEIRYTLDQSTPSATHGSVYSDPIHVSLSTTLKAVGCRTGWADSDVAVASYVISKPAGQLDAPVFFPEPGTYGATLSVTLSTSVYNASIRYTLDSSTPTPDHGTLYTEPLVIAANATIQAIACKEGWSDSEVSTGSYAFRVSPVSFNPVEGAYTEHDREITLSSTTPGASIRYTLDGTDPAPGTDYTVPIAVSGAQLIKAEAYRAGWDPSGVFEAEFVMGKLAVPTGLSGDHFGHRLELSGDGTRLAIGAPDRDVGLNPNQGSAYVYERVSRGWALRDSLTASEGAEDDGFGGSVSLSDDGSTIVVGAEWGDFDSEVKDWGAAYVFAESGGIWAEAQKLTATDAAEGNLFGCSVAMSDDGAVIVIGAQGVVGNRGAVYVFTDPGATGIWTEAQKLTASDGVGGDFFGINVDVSGDGLIIVIGAQGDDGNTGAAYVFTAAVTAGPWTEAATTPKLTASFPVAGDLFGCDVGISDDGVVIAVGARGRSSGAGAVCIFTDLGATETWTEAAALVASDAVAGDALGTGLTLSGNGLILVAGAPLHDTEGETDQGAVYEFTDSGAWSETRKLISPDPTGSDQFGSQVATADAGTPIFAGSPFEDTDSEADSGSAYWYE